MLTSNSLLRTVATAPASALALGLLSAVATAQGDCSSPTPITGLGVFTFDTTGETTSGFTPCTSWNDPNQDIFFLWFAPGAGDYVMTVVASQIQEHWNVHAGSDCNATCLFPFGAISTLFLPGVQAGDPFLIQIGSLFDGNTGSGSLYIGLDDCATVPDDAFEDNDTCQTSVPIATGTHPGLLVRATDEDWYELTVPASEVLTVVCTRGGAPAPIHTYLYDASCQNSVPGAIDHELIWLNGTGAPQTVRLNVAIGYTQEACVQYDLDIQIGPDPCSGPDDPFEDNDDCASSVPLPFGQYSGLRVFIGDKDFYEIIVPPMALAQITSPARMVNDLLQMYLWEPGCSVSTLDFVAVNTLGAGLIDVSNPNPSPLTVVLEVERAFSDFSCMDYDMDVQALPIPCATVADWLEENDTCATATLLPLGPYPGLSAYDYRIDPDYYRVFVPAGYDLDFDVLFDSAAGDLQVRAWDATCDQVLESSETTPTGRRVTVPNPGSLPLEVVFEVFLADLDASSCVTYDLDITVTSEPCYLPGVDDRYEENDQCQDALLIGNGAYPGLFVSQLDRDYFLLELDGAATLTADFDFTNADGDIDVYLYRWTGTTCGTLVASSVSGTDDEQITYTNTTGTTQRYALRVLVWDGSTSVCNTYDMSIAGTADERLGAGYCVPNSNSTGRPGLLEIFGSYSAFENDVTLVALQLPPGQFGYFLTSRTQAFFMPPGSQGNVCVGGNVGRYNAGAQLVQGPLGILSVDLTNLPVNPPVGAQPGETWNFQCWYRDAGGTSNFTDGVAVGFN